MRVLTYSALEGGLPAVVRVILSSRAPGFALGIGRPAARMGFIFASKRLAERLVRYRVLRSPELSAASDHSPVWPESDI